MITQPEYTAASIDLWREALRSDFLIRDYLEGSSSTSQSVRFAKTAALNYLTNFEAIMEDGLRDIATATVEYYEDQFDMQFQDRDEFIDEILNDNYSQKYYGTTLREKFDINRKRLMRNIDRSVLTQFGPEALAGVFTKSVPFGAQYNNDKRLLLGQAVKLEQDVARGAARRRGIQLVQWRLSHHHATPDICDELASYVDKAVVTYIEEQGLDISPKGIYFLDAVPQPPHPNCRCELGMVQSREIRQGLFKRSVERLRSLASRLRR